MVSTRTLISMSSSPLNNPVVTVPKAPITIGIIVTFVFHRFFQFPSKVQIIIIIIIIIIYSLEFFTSANADGFSLEFEWQQVSSSLQGSYQYSGRSQ